MKKISYKKWYLYGADKIHVNPPPSALNKIEIDMKLEKYYIKIRFLGNPMSSTSNIYVFKWALFEYGELEESLIFW